MILLPSTRQRIARIPFLFRAHECLDETGLYALSYGRRIYATFTRAGMASSVDQTGRLLRLPNGMPRVVSELASGARRAALLLESAESNLVLRSQEFDHATWNKGSCTVSANAAVAPDGSTTMDLLTASATNGTAQQDITVTGNGEKCFSVFFRPGTSTRAEMLWYDSTAGTDRHRVRITVTGGVPSLSTVGGAGYLFPVEYHFASGAWRLSATATGVVAANTNLVAFYPDRLVGTQSAYFWGAQAENAIVPSSYVPTAGATAGRVVDSLYFPLALTPRALAMYARGVELRRANIVAPSDSALLYIGAAGGSTAARLATYRSTAESGYRALHDPGTPAVASAVGAAAQRGDVVEIAALLASTGSVQVRAAINAGTEATSAASTAQALASAWAANRLYLNSFGTGSTGGFAFTHAAVLEGAQDTSKIRDLCEVG